MKLWWEITKGSTGASKVYMQWCLVVLGGESLVVGDIPFEVGCSEILQRTSVWLDTEICGYWNAWIQGPPSSSKPYWSLSFSWIRKVFWGFPGAPLGCGTQWFIKSVDVKQQIMQAYLYIEKYSSLLQISHAICKNKYFLTNFNREFFLTCYCMHVFPSVKIDGSSKCGVTYLHPPPRFSWLTFYISLFWS